MTAPSPSPYRLSDKLITQGTREIKVILSNSTLRVCSFDEINQPLVEKEMTQAFRQINHLLIKKYRKIIKDTYKSFGIILTSAEITAILAAIITSPDAVSGYIYKNEFPRKRERLVEGIVARPKKQDIRNTVKKHLPYLLLMMAHYMDTLTVDSRLDAMKRNGVQEVIWVTEEDERVCETCKALEGQIFRIDSVPHIPQHYRCRCHVEPVR